MNQLFNCLIDKHETQIRSLLFISEMQQLRRLQSLMYFILHNYLQLTTSTSTKAIFVFLLYICKQTFYMLSLKTKFYKHYNINNCIAFNNQNNIQNIHWKFRVILKTIDRVQYFSNDYF